MKRFNIILAITIFLAGCLPANPTAQPEAVPTPTIQVETPLPTRTTEPSATPPPESTLPPEPSATIIPQAETASPGLIDLDVLKNYSYKVKDFDFQAILVDGIYDDGQYEVRLVEPAAYGDLDGDGDVDAAVVLAIHSGGSGTFYNLVALLDQDGTPQQSGWAYIGDRQGIKNLEIANGQIVLDYITQGPNDPLCCASEHRLRSYLLEGGELRLAGEQILGSPETMATPLPNAILIDQPSSADPLTSPLQVRGRVSQAPPEMKLAYSVTDSNGTLLLEGEIPLQGEPGGPADFAFEFSLDPGSPGLVQLEVVDAAGGILRGRSSVILIDQ